MDDDEYDEACLDRFYQLQLTKLHDVCQSLASNTDLAICYKWLKIFGKAAKEDKYARSCLVLLMYEQIENEGRIGKPFTDMRLCSRSLEEVLAEQDKLVQQYQNILTESESIYTMKKNKKKREKGGAYILTKRMLADKNEVTTTSNVSSVQYQPTSLARTLELKHKISMPAKSAEKPPLGVKLQSGNRFNPSHNIFYSSEAPSVLNKQNEQPKPLRPILKLPSKWEETPSLRKEPHIHDMQKIWKNFVPQATSSIAERPTTHQVSNQQKPSTSTKKPSSIRQNPSQRGKLTLPPQIDKDSPKSRPPMRTSLSINSLKTFDSHKFYWTYANYEGKLPHRKPRLSRRPLDRQVGGGCAHTQTHEHSFSTKNKTLDSHLPKKDITDLGSIYSAFMNVSQNASTISNVIDLPEKPKPVQNNCCRSQKCFCKNHNEKAKPDLNESAYLNSKNRRKWTQYHEEPSKIKKTEVCELCRLYEEHERLQKDLKEANMELLASREINKRVQEEARNRQNTKTFNEKKKKLFKQLLYNSRIATHQLKRWNGKDNLDFLMPIFKLFRHDEDFKNQVLEYEKMFSHVLMKIIKCNLKKRETKVRTRYHIMARGKYERRKERAENRLRMQVAIEQQHQQLRKLTYLTLLKRIYLDECLGKIKISANVLGLLEDEYETLEKQGE